MYELRERNGVDDSEVTGEAMVGTAVGTGNRC